MSARATRSASRIALAERDADRLVVCARCGGHAVVHRECDRGQRYCSPACAAEARSASVRRAGVRYQTSAEGRTRHAARQGAYRERRSACVTHQCAVEPEPPLRVGEPSGMRLFALPAVEGHLLARAITSCLVCHQDRRDALRRASLRSTEANRRIRRARRAGSDYTRRFQIAVFRSLKSPGRPARATRRFAATGVKFCSPGTTCATRRVPAGIRPRQHRAEQSVPGSGLSGGASRPPHVAWRGRGTGVRFTP